MPNLIDFLDTSDIYDIGIMFVYDFNLLEKRDRFKFFYANFLDSGINTFLYLLTDLNDEHLSILRLVEVNICNKIYFQVKKSYSIIPNEGFGKILYELCFRYHEGSIVSDTKNTLPGSYNLWVSLINSKQYQIKKLNIKTGRISGIRMPLNELNIWGVENEMFEIINETEWESVVFEDEYTSEYVSENNNEEEEEEFDEYDEEFYVRYLDDNIRYQRNYLTDFIVRVLKQSKK